jgi:hypothetical protein
MKAKYIFYKCNLNQWCYNLDHYVLSTDVYKLYLLNSIYIGDVHAKQAKQAKQDKPTKPAKPTWN